MTRPRSSTGGPARTRSFWRDASAASAIEFAIVAMPFLLLLLGMLQVGVFYIAQSALDAGLMKTADNLRNGFASGTTPNLPGASTLKGNVATNSGGLIHNDGTLAVEIRQLANLGAATVAITDGTSDYGSATSTLVLRAQASITTFAPGFGGLAQARSSAIVRRQGR